ncbi:MAG TPA: hypothetical protein VK466_04740, partial [Terriglobales bacterium]|nr:hypothetical protein [Terriglobales bacterium]
MLPSSTVRKNEKGIALLGALIAVLLLSLLGAALLNVAGQEAINAATGRDAAQAQQLADAAGDIVMAWFHNPQTAPAAIAPRLAKQHVTVSGSPSYFDQGGRSQFTGTAERPDLVLGATMLESGQFFSGAWAGLFNQPDGLGTVQEIKLYGPSKPGLLSTIDATVSLRRDLSIRQSVRMQLGALELPAIRAAIQTGQGLGAMQSGQESPVEVHWGDFTVTGNLALRRTDDLPVLTAGASITGQSYSVGTLREDRWAVVRVGGEAQTTSPQTAPLPMNVHVRQNPSPGVHLDLWTYDYLKRIAMQHGQYFAVDREGLLYPQGVVEPGRGFSPDDVLRSRFLGDHRGLIFIDTLDQTAPRLDNLAVVTITAPYLEGHIVVAGHVVLKPGASSLSVPVLSPPTDGSGTPAARVPVLLSGVQFNGVLYTAGNLTVAGPTKVFGIVTAEGAIVSSGSGAKLEVWYDYDMSRGLYRGVPLVYRAPGTWMARY